MADRENLFVSKAAGDSFGYIIPQPAPDRQPALKKSARTDARCLSYNEAGGNGFPPLLKERTSLCGRRSSVMENWILVAALSLDTLFACVAYGIKKIRIPFLSAVVMAAVGTGFLLLSILLRGLTGRLFPEQLIRYLGFAVLIVMGMINIFQSLLKSLLRRDKTIRFSVSEYSFVLKICLDETEADIDDSKQLSLREAFLLALTLSADSLLTGFSITAAPLCFALLGLFSFGMGLLAVLIGTAAGRRVSENSCCNLSWVSGLLLIVIAFLKIL